MAELIKLELTQEECELFRLFQMYHEHFQIMVDAGVFTLKGTNAIINFTPDGYVGTVQIQPITYRRKAEV